MALYIPEINVNLLQQKSDRWLLRKTSTIAYKSMYMLSSHQLADCCFLFFNNTAKKSVQIEGGGKYGGFGHLWPSGEWRSPVGFCFQFFVVGVWRGAVASQNRRSGVQKRTRGLSADH
jgi:hypothetical protein